MKNLFIFFFVLVLCSCEDQFLVKLPRPETEQLPNLFCVIGPHETTIACRLDKSIPIYGEPARYQTKDYEPIPDANIVIKGPKGNVTLNYNAQSEFYTAQVAPDFLIEGGSYSIHAQLPNSEVLIAETTIPIANIQDVSIKMDSLVQNDGFWSYKTLLTELKFKDKAGVGDIYRISGSYTNDTTQNWQIPIHFNSRFKFLLDEDKDGSYLNEIGNSEYNDAGTYFKYQINISSVTKDYYLYHLSLNAYTEYSDDNPFVEPSINYSNIEGGLGLFSGRVSKQFEFLID